MSARTGAVLSILYAVGCRGASAENTASTASAATSLTGPLAIAATTDPAADDGQWTMPAKDYASTRFSRLNEINTTTVNRLRVAWTFSTGVMAGHEAAPLVVGSTMFLVTPFPNFVYALDLGKPGAPVKWKYDPLPRAPPKASRAATSSTAARCSRTAP